MSNSLLHNSRYTLAKSVITTSVAGTVYDEHDEQIAEIRVRPRILWGCLTVFGSVFMFFAMPVAVGWLVNSLLKLFGTNLQAVGDRNLALVIPLVILIVASGIVGAMVAAWSLYRQTWKIVTTTREPLLEIVETAKYGAASLSAKIRNGAGTDLGYVHRDMWGNVTAFDAAGNRVLKIRSDASAASQLGESGVSTAIMVAVAFITAMFLGTTVLTASRGGRNTYRIFRTDDTTNPAGSVLPMDSRARRVRFSDALSTDERQLALASVVLLLVYDF